MISNKLKDLASTGVTSRSEEGIDWKGGGPID